jgi:hypothetical protein
VLLVVGTLQRGVSGGSAHGGKACGRGARVVGSITLMFDLLTRLVPSRLQG